MSVGEHGSKAIEDDSGTTKCGSHDAEDGSTGDGGKDTTHDSEFGFELSIEDEGAIWTAVDQASEAYDSYLAAVLNDPMRVGLSKLGPNAWMACRRLVPSPEALQSPAALSTPPPWRAVHASDPPPPPPTIISVSTPAADTPTGDAAGGDAREQRRGVWRPDRTRKPLRVTDITAGAWCELQHWYIMTRQGGRRTVTPAIEAGVKVHRVLEETVHVHVPVRVATREDRIGLRVLNLIQGLTSLRDAGITRELDVWGFVDGNVISGVIDGLSAQLPARPVDVVATDAPTDIEDAAIYLTEVKTVNRNRSSVPPFLHSSGRVQISLYHRLLSEMVQDPASFDFLRVFRRYGAEPDVPFSDVFLDECKDLFELVSSGSLSSSLHESASSDSQASADPSAKNSSEDPAQRPPRTLRELLPALQAHLLEAFPHGAQSIGKAVSLEFRGRDDGNIVSTDTFTVDPDALNAFVDSSMELWRGDREPRGVPVNETYKCRVCEFAEDCEWRATKSAEYRAIAMAAVVGQAGTSWSRSAHQPDRSSATAGPG